MPQKSHTSDKTLNEDILKELKNINSQLLNLNNKIEESNLLARESKSNEDATRYTDQGGSKEKSDFHRKFYGFESPQKEKRDVFREKKKKRMFTEAIVGIKVFKAGRMLAEFDIREHSRLLLVVFVVRISLKSRDSQKITKYGCRADDNNSNQFSYSFNHSYYHTDITKHRCEGTRQ
ncbi:Hypothetical predicted protein [Octopus vulgaris]|uniref:Uncharacterized protein n=1 Tax=Octopus vulgaris TaxID=6645 RepID=A0AA36AJT3_OCTVU|nr:Hypothetical predicted protein [Octopus vulgaris]